MFTQAWLQKLTILALILGAHSLFVRLNHALLLQGANGLQTSAQAVGGLPKQGLFNASQDLPDQQLACKRPLQHMTEQQLEATLSRMRSEIALQVSAAPKKWMFTPW